MNCREFTEIADLYLDDELLVETNHDVLKHLETCADCRRELGARRAVRAKLRAGFANSPALQMEQNFSDRLRAQLAPTAHGRKSKQPRRAALSAGDFFNHHRLWLTAATACLLIAAITFVALRRGVDQPPAPVVADRQTSQPNEPTQPTSTNSPDDNGRAPVQIVKAEFARAAAGDHQNCAVKFKLKEHPITLEAAAKLYDPAYAGLVQSILRDGKPPTAADVQFVEAHSCVFEGRRFAHIVFRHQGRLVSLLVMEDGERQSAPAQNNNSGAQNADSEVNACSPFDGYEVACFATARHLIFVVSDLPETENLSIARNLAPGVAQHLRRIETGA